MQKLSPSISIKTVIHAPGFYEFAKQILFHARYRAKLQIIKPFRLKNALFSQSVFLLSYYLLLERFQIRIFSAS